MAMGRIRKITLSLLAILLLPIISFAAEQNLHSEISIGYHAVGTDDSMTRVAEYQTTDSSAHAKARFYGNVGKNFFDISASYWDDDENSASADVDLSRIFRVRLDYSEFIHRLDHDELYRHYIKKSTTLANPDFKIPIGVNSNSTDPTPDCYAFKSYPDYDDIVAFETHGPKAFRYTDLDVNKNYMIRRDLTKIHSELQLPFFPNVIVHGDYSYETKKGHRQVMTMTHCASCHIVSHSKRIDQTTQIWAVGATFKAGILTVDYTYRMKQFYRDHDAVYNFYELSHRPPLWDPIYGGEIHPNPEGTFGNRLNFQYDTLRFARVPETDKHTHTIKARLDLPYSTTVTGMYVYSKTKDKDRTEELRDDLELEYESYMGRITTGFIKHLTLTVGAKYYTIDSDDAHVKDLGPAPNPSEGNWTYEGYLAATPDIDFSYDRKSVADRDVTEIDASLNYHFNTYLSVRLGYRIKTVDRDHGLQYWENRAALTDAYNDEAINNSPGIVPADYKLDEYDYGDPTIQTVDAAVYFYPMANLNGWVSFTYEHNDDPFEYPHAKGEKYKAIETALSPNFCLHKDTCQCPADCDPTCDPHSEECVCVHGASNLAGASNYADFFVPLNRIEEGTNQPTDKYEIKASFNWSPTTNTAISPSFSYTNEDNDDTPWEREAYTAGVSLWWAPTHKINVTLAYNYFHEKTTTDYWFSFFNG
ncbi:hypothetical protein TST_1590 [Thermosulfidibacter takaii ABI70S6]|uniref:Uncharacterized protein n=2 Tax=Thermosulfidibacter takaii TaxID=412593 RepID=A0A0S3QVN0_THET7|nr:hypothetical protein TST_1590 [Thermosulfidibacter takaii ABI70S6]